MDWSKQYGLSEIRVLVPGQDAVVASRIGSKERLPRVGSWVWLYSGVRALLTPTSPAEGPAAALSEKPEEFQAEVDQLRHQAWKVNAVVLMALLGLWQLFKLGGNP